MSGRLPFSIALCLLAANLSVDAAFPVIQSNRPLGLVAGTETEIHFRGSRLGDAYDALSDINGLKVVDVSVVSEAEVRVQLTTTRDLTPGLYPIRLVTRTGISNIKLIGVGQLPITNEVEPNDSVDLPQSIDLGTDATAFGTTVEGIIQREDVDCFQFELDAGQRLTAEIEGIRLGYILNNRGILDPHLSIVDEDHVELVSSDDSILLGQDGVCSIVAVRSGRYTVRVRDVVRGGGPTSGYRLHVGNFPRPMGVFPGGGKPGETFSLKTISAHGDRETLQVTLPESVPRTAVDRIRMTDRWPVTAQTRFGISPSPNWIRVNQLDVVRENEPNDNLRNTQQYPVPVALCGTIGHPGDVDCFSFPAEKGQAYRINCFARHPTRSPLDAAITVLSPKFKKVTSADDVAGSADPSVEFTCPSDGLYTLRIVDHLGQGSDRHQYRVEITRANPTFQIKLKETRRNCAAVATVPIGGRTAIVARVQRLGYDGPIRLRAEGDLREHHRGIPSGVTVTDFPMPAGQTEIPILFSASRHARRGSGLFRVAGQSELPNEASDTGSKSLAVVGLDMVQEHALVLGQNRRVMFDYLTDYAAIAVTDAAPFTISLLQPSTSIIRGGSKMLTVRLNRKKGFTGEVSLRALYNPPGIGINNSKEIAKDQSEVQIPITASSKAATGTWPIILTATYRRNHGSAEISTNAIQLKVQRELLKLRFPRVSVDQGSQTTIDVVVEHSGPLPGAARVQLAGLPAGVTCTAGEQPLNQETKTLRFPISVAKKAKVGRHKTLVCIASIIVGDETIVQTISGGQLRIDKPLTAAFGETRAEPE